MDVITEFLNRVAYKFPKGYPDLNDPADRDLLESLMNLNEEEEKPQISRDQIKGLIDDIDDQNRLNTIYKNIINSAFSNRINPYLETKNLTKKDINDFLYLLGEEDMIGEFANIADNAPTFDPNKNAFEQIPGFSPDVLKRLFIEMKDSIKGTVSLGPGENFLSVFFNNVSKQGKKGDLNIDNKEVELKSRTGDTGALVNPKSISRGDFTKTIKPKITKIINSLGLDVAEKAELELKNSKNFKGTWPIKLKAIFDIYKEFENADPKKFIKGVDEMFKTLYPSLSFDINSYFSNNGFEASKFAIDLAKKAARAYAEEEKFDAIMFMDPNGNLKYYDKVDDFINAIGGDVIATSPSDAVPRFKI